MKTDRNIKTSVVFIQALNLFWHFEMRECRVFEKRVLGKLFETKSEKVAGCWSKLHVDQLHDWYSSSNIICTRKSRDWNGWACGTDGGEEICAVLAGKPARNAVEMRSHISENNIKVHLKAGGRSDVEWICLDQGSSKCRAVVHTLRMFQTP
jgi:hypothetical protein